MRKVVLATLLFLNGNQVFAAAYADESWRGNWLVGGSGIYAQRRGSLDVSMRYSPTVFGLGNGAFPILETDNLYSNKGFGWGLLAGYQLKSHGWTWGVEASVDWHDISQRRDVLFTDVVGLISWDARSLYKRQPITALSGRMAYEMAPYFIPYIRLGIEGSHDLLEVSMIGSSGAVTPINPLINSDSRWNWHYLAGVGVETPLWCTPMTVRIEYNYHSRGRPLIVNGTQGLAAGVVVPQAFTFRSEMHNRTQSGKLSLVWNFY